MAYHCSGPPTADDDQYTTAVALGIKDFDTRHVHTVQLNYYVSGSLDDERWAPLIDLSASYTYFPNIRASAQGLQPPQFPAYLHGRG